MKITFEWDENKNQINIEKHGISFEDAIHVFNGPFLERVDNRFDYGETRYILLGRMRDNIVVVIYTKRNDKTRLISIRQANKHERKTYQIYIQDRLGAFGSDE